MWKPSDITNVCAIYQAGENLGAAVCALEGEKVKGLVRFVQVSESTCVIDGTLTGRW